MNNEIVKYKKDTSLTEKETTENENAVVVTQEQAEQLYRTITEERGGKLVRITASDGYILKSRHGHLRKSVLVSPDRASGWEAVKEVKNEK